MTMRMLIDARHREETRVAVVKGNRIEEFDFESAERKQLKGNIYLAKVTRVEPSLQAAFVDYGGNRHGFLAFSEIHPDYYQIPREDREALLREEAEHAAEEAALRAAQDEDDDESEDHSDDDAVERFENEGGENPEVELAREGREDEIGDEAGDAPRATTVNDDQVEALRQRRMNLRRRYKIQDVIRRRQVLLVQVVKEERGNKGAALTTYLSLAGRYCVLMPNTSHGGGISRKISNAGDRKRLKSIMAELQLPASMGCIVRTAGLQRTKTEIKRDFDYLARLWDGIREKTLSSSAPALIYGDSDLIKRAIRDIYNKDIDEVIVEGDDGYRQAKEFMKLLMPSHAKKVKHYSDAVPLYQRAHVEDQLAAMYHPVVQLKSGGYLVINPTEALVSIDINSGRSTREHNIEQTATATNLEAAQEIARQLRLRDMAGLVVIDFIDMDNGSNVRKVEKAMKEALKNDRARIQVGRISSFGLMEMSRQRLRTGVLEASTRACPHCEGTGLVRTASSAGLSALRMIEDEAARGRGSLLTLRCSQEAAIYVLNRKRADIAEIEDRYGVKVEIIPDGEQEGARMSVEASGPPPAYAPKFEPIVEPDEPDLEIEDEIDEEEEDEAEEAAEAEARPAPAEGEGSGSSRKRRRRRGRRGRSRTDEQNGEAQDADAEGGEASDEPVAEMVGEQPVADLPEPMAGDEAPAAEASESSSSSRLRRSRRSRGGRSSGEAAAVAGDSVEVQEAPVADETPVSEPAPVAEEAPVAEAAPEAPTEEPVAPKRSRSRRRPAATVEEAPAEVTPAGNADLAVAEAPAEVVEAPKPKRTRRKTPAAEPVEAVAEPAPVEPTEAVEAPKPKRTRRKATPPVAPEAAPEAPAEPIAPIFSDAPEPAAADTTEEPAEGTEAPRRGWWQRTFGN
jgi:ribonuclease E